MDWKAFLRQKCAADDSLYEQRVARIEAWRQQRGGEDGSWVSETARAAWEREVAVVSEAIDGAHARLKNERS